MNETLKKDLELSSRGKWTSIPYYKIDSREIERTTGVPIKTSHEFLIETTEEGIEEWATWFLDR